MRDVIRDSYFGHLLRLVYKPRWLRYAEELDGFVIPKFPQSNSGDTNGHELHSDSLPSMRGPDLHLVSWYDGHDDENPRNWTLGKKCYVTFLIMILTTTVYVGSAIYAPAVGPAAEYFGVSTLVSSLGISLFVAGYGIGPLFLSGITEVPAIGRTSVYIITLLIFFILQILTALVDNFAGLLVLRFVAGFMGSPALATAGASLDDMFPAHKLAYSMGFWGLAAEAAPAMAPIISGFVIQSDGWRWAFWEMSILSGFCLILLFFFLPETSPDTILLRRAQRIRRQSSNPHYQSRLEITHALLPFSHIVVDSLLRPIALTCTEPIIIAINLYTGLVYATLYSFFESFPIVYEQGYGWELGVSTLPFAALFIGSFIGWAIYSFWNWKWVDQPYNPNGPTRSPETRIPCALIGAFCLPTCILWFAWTANKVHWIAPVLSGIPFGMASTLIFNPFLTYLPYAYPQYAASALASNDFFRSMMGAGMPIAAHPLFHNLGVDWGNTIIGLLSVAMIPIPFVLYKAGPWLRERSKIAL
ncbi:uncharacterized protein I303_105059 [Kwoniella dejecticola CBS 10117]|uniref:Major facilitator superfamily (MFS) profile domain-containing protein n=1 Tax=Kwoniella dejecticola CBS 10117 TaxID=1296121 RepID=A0A1A6A3K2_9TREE|nr:uncharacterized protein I303_05495 [Kwoniella dejecticola CBS 10117]OBR84636.1 hypothetical protein I303_05495 [Kwoniella dejecticola CBS 10117]